jgi:glycosyltransferase involved in cell wall biosynthesis
VDQKLKVYILGSEGVGWSIDKDRENTEKFITELNYKVTNNILLSNIIYCVWWNVAYKYRFLLRILKKKLIVTVTNDLANKSKKIIKLKGLVDIWICANEKQKSELIKCGVEEQKITIIPFYVSEDDFKKLEVSKKNLCNNLGINYSDIQGKFLIGSFQRDSQSLNLTSPRWQKNPGMIVDILKEVNKEKYFLILAGPGRHYLVSQCRKHKISYIYVGDESYIDNMENDLTKNNQNEKVINNLYNLVDLYIVSSKSEGGPKAVLEAALTETMIISTDVGMAPDILKNECIYEDDNKARIKLNNMIEKNKELDIVEIIKYNLNSAKDKNNYQKRKQLIRSLLEGLVD